MTRRLLLAAAGIAWLGALFLPWSSRGTLSAAALVDAVGLVRRGAVEAVLPPMAAVVLVLPALAGIALVGLVGFAGRGTTTARAVAAAVGALVTLGLAARLTGADPGRLGPGAWLGLAGVVVVGAVGLVAVLRLARR